MFYSVKQHTLLRQKLAVAVCAAAVMTGVYGAAVMRVTACRTEPIAAERIDPNTATAAGLMRLPGVGRTRAMDIIAARPYRTAAELDRVRGIGPKTMEKITPYVALENSDEQRKK